MAYSGSKRSKDEFAAGEEDLIKQQQLENPAKLARGGWEATNGDEQHWKRVHHQSNSSSAALAPSSNVSNNTNACSSSGNNPQLNFQQRVLAAAALQEIRASSPAASFKFPLDSSSSSTSGLLDHLPPLSPAIPQQTPPPPAAAPSQPRSVRELDSLYSPLLQGLPPIVHQPMRMIGNELGSGNASYSGLLQAPPQAQMIHQLPMLPPAPGLLSRDACTSSWFSTNLMNNSLGNSSSKDSLLLPPYQDVLTSLMQPPSLNSFGNPAPAPDFPEQYQQIPQQMNPPLVSTIQHQHQQQQHQQQMTQNPPLVPSIQQQQHQNTHSYRSDLIPPPAEMMFSNNGYNPNSSALQRTTSGSKMMINHSQQQQQQQSNLVSGKFVSGAHNLAAAGSSYCSSEIAASSVTSVHNAAASSSNTTMQNGSPEDGTTLAQRIPHNQHHSATAATTTNPATNHKQAPTRTYTKVYKLGSIGRAVDVTRFSNYTELRWELARMFNLEGQLDQKSGWQLVFIDHEGDILLVGDDPWEEFVTSVRGIRILSPSEVAFYTNNETGSGAAHSTLTSTGI